MADVKDVADLPSLFVHRITEKVVTIQGVDFTIKDLPTSLATYIIGTSFNGGMGEAIYHTVCFGLVDVKGWKDGGKPVKLETEKVKILGREYVKITQDFYDKLPPYVPPILYQEISNLSSLSEEEERKLDFTSTSPSEG